MTLIAPAIATPVIASGTTRSAGRGRLDSWKSVFERVIAHRDQAQTDGPQPMYEFQHSLPLSQGSRHV